MSLIINADSEYLTGTGGSFGTSGLTEGSALIWVKRDSGTSSAQGYFCVAPDVALNTNAFQVSHNGVYGDCFVYPQNSQRRAIGGGANSTAWQMLLFTYKQGEPLRIYTGLAGGSLNTYTEAATVTEYLSENLTQVRIGRAIAEWFARARLAHAAFWNKQLTGAQAAELLNGGTASAGKNPQAVQNANLTFYSPLTSDATVTIGGISLSATGTLTYDGADNPNVEAYGGSTPTLVIADSAHGHLADALVLTSQHSLTVAESTHGHTADNLTLSVLGTLEIADALHAHLADSITLTVSAAGTITIPAMKDWSTGNLKAGETGVQVDIHNISTGALVVRKTGQTTHATTGVCVVTDAAIAAGTTYEVVTRLADGSKGMWDYAAS